MFIPVHQAFDLTATLQSGQTFRWIRDGEWYIGVVFGNIVRVRQRLGGLQFFSAPDDERGIENPLRDYLGLQHDLDAIYASIGMDEHVKAAVNRYQGLRILRQDPWECLVSFICSSASNIPRICRNVEDICSSFGHPIRLGDHVRHTFPSPRELAEVGEKRLRKLKLGYRAGYLAAVAKVIADGEFDLIALREDSYEDALAALTELEGVGDKVANCVLLFSLDKPKSFPVDVWVNRILQEWYLDSDARKMSRLRMRTWAQDYFGSYAGYANQYLFHDRRMQGLARR